MNQSMDRYVLQIRALSNLVEACEQEAPEFVHDADDITVHGDNDIVPPGVIPVGEFDEFVAAAVKRAMLKLIPKIVEVTRYPPHILNMEKYLQLLQYGFDYLEYPVQVIVEDERTVCLQFEDVQQCEHMHATTPVTLREYTRFEDNLLVSSNLHSLRLVSYSLLERIAKGKVVPGGSYT